MLPWHTILHEWNGRLLEQMQVNGCAPWSDRCMIEYWKVIHNMALLDVSRCVKRALARNRGSGSLGRPFDVSDAPLIKFCSWPNLSDWKGAGYVHVVARPTISSPSYLCKKRERILLLVPSMSCRMAYKSKFKLQVKVKVKQR